MVRTEDACEIIKYALQNEIKVYLDGGWGVDALLKRESRIHNDIAKPHTIYMSPKGKIFNQQKAVELSKMENILIDRKSVV